MNRFIDAVTFLTRIPLPRNVTAGAREVGRSTLFFPLIGAVIGAGQYLLLWILSSIRLQPGTTTYSFRPLLLSVLIVASGVIVTGALHLDGLADMADGFGGGHTREDILRIMRDHAIGTYGAVALILVLILKIVSLANLIAQGTALKYLIIAPALARGSVVVLGFYLPYARPAEGGLGSSSEHIRGYEMAASTGFCFGLSLLAGWRRAGVFFLLTLLVSICNARMCMRRIGGFTGDTLGANLEICEALILAIGSALG